MSPQTKFLIGLLLGMVSYWWLRRRSARRSLPGTPLTTSPNEATISNTNNSSPDGKKKKLGGHLMYPGFKDDFLSLMKICYPSYTCTEARLTIAFGIVLLVRTLLSLAIAEIDGAIVKNLVQMNMPKLMKNLSMWFGVGLPSSYINAFIKNLQTRLALAYRERLSHHAVKLYFANDAYYRIGNLDSRLQNVDHLLTEDISQWAERTADVMSSMGKPIVDLLVFSTALVRSLGGKNQALASIVIVLSGEILRAVRPNFARLVQEKAAREGDLRWSHTRIIANAEEIAFFGGHHREEVLLESTFVNLTRSVRRSLRLQFHYRAMEDFVTKYLWSTVGIFQLSVPMYLNRDKRTAGQHIQFFTAMKRMMLRNAEASERIVLGIKEVAEVIGYTQHVSGLLSTLRDMHDGKYNLELMGTTRGEVEASEDIEVKDLPIVSPSGDLLVKAVTFKLTRKDRLLIHGPNGCGKSSLFRILCGLWPALGGVVKKPERRTDILFLPQRPYLVKGTFRDQVIYPDSAKDMHEKGVTDDDLTRILSSVDMEVPSAGWDIEQEWKDTLSGGEKQRVGLARVLYHKPKYAILDECTSAITVDGEFNIFKRLVGLDMGIITISHRQTMVTFHNKLLSFDGEGGYSFEDIRSEGVQAMTQLADEKAKLIGRLRDICKQLGEDAPKIEEDKN
eukprot:PhM_4_TR11296/c1_g1_i1/m.93325/K15628/PXA; ATP-binding cassette, subfamily D (ALD), peroxisomal long-chain fatty acid import protein